MSAPFPFPLEAVHDSSVETANKILYTAPYWTRLKVPKLMPELAAGPWAFAIMAHYNPFSERCWIVAIGNESLLWPFLSRFRDGVATGGPADMVWATEWKAESPVTRDTLEVFGCKVLNELPPVPDVPPCPIAPAASPDDEPWPASEVKL